MLARIRWCKLVSIERKAPDFWGWHGRHVQHRGSAAGSSGLDALAGRRRSHGDIAHRRPGRLRTQIHRRRQGQDRRPVHRHHARRRADRSWPALCRRPAMEAADPRHRRTEPTAPRTSGCAIQRTPEREKLFNFIGPSLYTIDYHFLVRSDDNLTDQQLGRRPQAGTRAVVLVNRGYAAGEILAAMGSFTVDASSPRAELNLHKAACRPRPPILPSRPRFA